MQKTLIPVPPYLNVFAPGNLLEILLLLEGLVHPVIRHAEAPQAGLYWVIRFGKNNKLGHGRDAYQRSVQLRG